MPISYTYAGTEEMLGRINKICDRLTEQTGAKWSTHTRVLIFNSLAAIVEDPLPDWQRSRSSDRRKQQASLLRRLPRLLRAMASGRRQRPITYFEVLHWLTDHLDAICPFQKRVAR